MAVTIKINMIFSGLSGLGFYPEISGIEFISLLIAACLCYQTCHSNWGQAPEFILCGKYFLVSARPPYSAWQEGELF